MWSKLLASFWFLPSVIVAFSAILALGLIEVDSSAGKDLMINWPRLFGAGAAGTRGMLSTIAGAMATVVGVTFSMTLVALTLASSQYSSRILRSFMSDRFTQVALGIFAGIFTYCLIVLRAIRDADEGGFIPSISTTFSLMLAIAGVGTLIVFIHHIASSIQASSIIASVARETLAAIERNYPDTLANDPECPIDDDVVNSPITSPTQKWQSVTAMRNGYFQSVDMAALLRVAREYKTVVRMELGVGEFVIQNRPIASLSLENPVDQEIIEDLRAAYSIDRRRTVQQDCSFGIRQLVDMALRSLSPGINDTTTAVMCVDYLTAILALLVSRKTPPSRLYEGGELRVITVRKSFSRMISESFDEIRGSSEGNVTVMLHMLGAIQTIVSMTDNPGRQEVLWQHAEHITDLARRSIKSPHDMARFENYFAQVGEAIGLRSPEREPTNPSRHIP